MPIRLVFLSMLWGFIRLYQTDDEYDRQTFVSNRPEFMVNVNSSAVCYHAVPLCPAPGTSCPCCADDAGDNPTGVRVAIASLCLTIMLWALAVKTSRDYIIMVCSTVCWLLCALAAPLLFIPEYKTPECQAAVPQVTPEPAVPAPDSREIERAHNSGQTTGRQNRRIRQKAAQLEWVRHMAGRRARERARWAASGVRTIKRFNKKEARLVEETSVKNVRILCTRGQIVSMMQVLSSLKCIVNTLRGDLKLLQFTNKGAIQQYVQMHKGILGNTGAGRQLKTCASVPGQDTSCTRVMVDSATSTQDKA